MFNRRQILLLVVCALGFSTLLWSANDYFALMRGDRIGASFCSINAYWNCDLASMSPMGTWHGVPLGLFGAAWFFVVAVLSVSGVFFRKALRLWLLLGLATVVVLIAYLAFQMKTGCIICFASHALIISAAALGWSVSGFRMTPKALGFSLAAGFAAIMLFGYFSQLSLQGNFSEDEFQKWFRMTEAVPATSKLMHGSPDAPVTVTEFSDFGCPFCALAAETLLPFLSQQSDVRVFFYPFPLDNTCNSSVQQQVHRHSCDWAKATICANEQGKAWPFHDRIFKIAREAGELPPLYPRVDTFDLKMEEFRACMEKPETAAELQSMIEVGKRLNISSTPSFFINGRRWEGFLPMPLLRRVLVELRK